MNSTTTTSSSPVVSSLSATQEDISDQSLAPNATSVNGAGSVVRTNSFFASVDKSAPSEIALHNSLGTPVTSFESLQPTQSSMLTRTPSKPHGFQKQKSVLAPVASVRGSERESLENVAASDFADKPVELVTLSKQSSSKQSFLSILSRPQSRNSLRHVNSDLNKNKVVPDPSPSITVDNNPVETSVVPSMSATTSRRGSITESEATLRRRSSFMSNVNSLAQNVTGSISKFFTNEDTSEAQRRQSKVAELVNNQVLQINAAQIAHMQKQSAHFLTISAFSTLRKWWDLLLTLCVVHVSLVYPVQIGFNVHHRSGPTHIIDLLVDALYLFEIVLNTLTSYVDETSGVEIKQLSTIRHHYFHSWSFGLDIISCVPSEWLLLFVSIPSALWNCLRLVKLVRALNLRQRELFKSITRRLNNVTNPSMIRMLELGAVFLLSQHYVGCLYFYISRTQDEATTWSPDSMHGGASLTIQYIDAIYFAIMVTTANDVAPTNSKEKMFTSVMLLLGIVINASIIGSAANLLSNLDKAQTDRKNQLDAIHEFLRYKKVPPKLQDQIRRYYEYYLAGRLEDPMENMFGHMPHRLKLALKMNLYQSFVKKVALFKACSTEGVIAIVQCMLPIVVMPGDLIICEGEIGNEFYFIKSGTVNLTIGSEEDAVSLGVLSEGSFFGESAVLTDGPSTANVRAESITELMCITKNDFLKIAKIFPTFYMAIKRISDSRLKNAKKVAQQQGKAQGPVPSLSRKRTPLIRQNSTTSAGRAAQKLLTKARTIRARFAATHGVDSRFIEKISLAHARKLVHPRALDTVGPGIEVNSPFQQDEPS